MRDPYDLVGTLVDRRYAVKRVVAEGGFGVVYEAQAISLGLPVALKVLRDEALLSSEEQRARFAQEAKLLARLKHPAIVELADASHLPDGTPYLVLAWIEGETLDARIRRLGALSVHETVELLSPVVSAVSYAHKLGVVHRDLKPGNLMVTPSGGARVLDFGVARWSSDLAVRTTTTSKTGISLGYAAPEQYGKEFGPVDGRTDEFALAAIVYAAITGKPAFSGESMTEVLFATCAKKERPSIASERPELPQAIDAVVRRALSIQPTDRFDTIEDFWTAFTVAAEGVPATLPETPKGMTAHGAAPSAVTLPSPERLGRSTEPSTEPSTENDAFASTQPAPGLDVLRAPPPSAMPALTLRQGEAPPESSVRSSRPAGKSGKVLLILALGGIVGGVLYAASPWFAPSPPPSPSTKPSWANGSTATAARPLDAGSATTAPIVPPCGLDMLDDEICVIGTRFHRGPLDCGTAGAQADHRDACPGEDAQVKTFAIDRNEVSRARYQKCVDAQKCAQTSGATDDAPELPVRFLTADDAAVYCAFDHGRRLPTDAEWELAAAGGSGRLFPWGNQAPTPALAVFSSDDRALTAPSPVGSMVAGATPDGVLDLSGNVAEWTSTAPSKGTGERFVRGGSFGSQWDSLRTWARAPYAATYTGGDIGVRCARSITLKPPTKPKTK